MERGREKEGGMAEENGNAIAAEHKHLLIIIARHVDHLIMCEVPIDHACAV